MTHDQLPHACERARRWAALAPDAELSTLETRLLHAHTARCPRCARVAADIQAFTNAVRTAPQEPPPAAISLYAAARRRPLRHRVPGLGLAGRVAAVAAVGVVGFTLGTRSPGEVPSAAAPRPILITPSELASADAEVRELRVFRRSALLSVTPAAPRLGKRPGPQPL